MDCEKTIAEEMEELSKKITKDYVIMDRLLIAGACGLGIILAFIIFAILMVSTHHRL